MRKDLVDILACPVCKGGLDLRVDEEEEGNVVMGALLCGRCNESYPIEDSIPNLMPPELRELQSQ